MSRFYGLGSVSGKTLRDSTAAVVVATVLLSAIVLATIVAIGDQFDTAAERQLLARQMEALPALFQGLLGKPINVETLPGFLSWRLVGVMPLMVGLWSVMALGGTLAGEAARGTLEVVLATPVSRRSLAVQKLLGHVVAVALALTAVAIVASLGSIAFAALPGDETSVATSLSEFALVATLSLFAGAMAFAAANFLGASKGAGLAGGYLFGAYAINGYAGLVPGFDVLRVGSIFYWTAGHRPMAGVSDWPAVGLVAALAAVMAIVGIVSFERRDLAARIGLPARLDGVRARRLGLGRLSVGSWSLHGPGARSLAERLPEAIGWGAAMGSYGLFVAFGADSFASVINSLPQLAEMIRTFYPELDFESVGGVLQFAIFAFVALLIGLASASLVHGWSSDERDGRLEMTLSSPIRRSSWFVRSGGGLLLALLAMGAAIGLGPAVGALLQGDEWHNLFSGGLVLGLYGAALTGVGLLVGGAGWPHFAALAVGALTLGFYLLDLLGGLLDLPRDVLNLSLTQHLGRPMIGDYDMPGIVVCIVLALGGLLVGAWTFGRRDLRARSGG